MKTTDSQDCGTRRRDRDRDVAAAAMRRGRERDRGDRPAERRFPQGSEQVALDPSEFTTEIDNEWWPMTVGSRWVYREAEGGGPAARVVVTVTPRTREIANGVEARVVHDVVSVKGEPVEITDDWYAQDAEGNVWYLGEDTAEYENGKKVSTEGSFEAGVGGAEAGVIMPADPVPASPTGRSTSRARPRTAARSSPSARRWSATPAGSWDDVLMTRDLVPTEPGVQELQVLRARRRPGALAAHGRGRAGGARLLPRGPGQLRRRRVGRAAARRPASSLSSSRPSRLPSPRPRPRRRPRTRPTCSSRRDPRSRRERSGRGRRERRRP